MITEKYKRLKKVNNLIKFISERGRGFFKSKSLASICIINNRFYFFDDYSEQMIYMWNNKRWQWRFSHGGTLRQLLLKLKNYVITGQPLIFIIPYTFQNENIWGYPEDDAKEIEDYAKSLGLIEYKEPEKAEDVKDENPTPNPYREL